MEKKSENSFFKPVLSTLGLILSFIVAISPLLPFNRVSVYFIDEKYAWPASILSLILGMIVSWLVFSFYQYIEWTIGTKKNGNYTLPRWRLGPKEIIWILMLLIILMFIFFFSIPSALYQTVVYILFFTLIIFVFSLLVSMTKDRYEYLASKENESEQIFNTLEKNRLINQGIAIYSTELVTQEERQSLNIRSNELFLKKIRIETVVQKKEHIEVILTNDCKELVRVLSKKEVN